MTNVRVTPKPREQLPYLLKRFKKLCEREGIMRDIRKNEAYEKPSEKRRRKHSKRRPLPDVEQNSRGN